MGQPAPDHHVASSFPGVRIARPVGFPVGGVWVEQLGYLLGYCKHEVASVTRLPTVNGTTAIRYVRSPGAVALLLCVRPNVGTSVGDRMTVSPSVGGAGTLAGTSTVLDGTTGIATATSTDGTPDRYFRYFDVSGLTVGTGYELVVTTASHTGTSKGIFSMRVEEIARVTTDPVGAPSTDPGVAWVWPRGGNYLFSGSASAASDGGAGFERIIGQLDDARSKVRRFPLNICSMDSDANAWSTTSAAFANPTWNFTGAATRPRWYTRAKRLYGTSTANQLTARVRYKSAGGELQVRIITTPVGGAATNNDIVCPLAAAHGTIATGAVTIATSGTNQEAFIEIEEKVAGGGTAYVSAISLHDNEV